MGIRPNNKPIVTNFIFGCRSDMRLRKLIILKICQIALQLKFIQKMINVNRINYLNN